MDIDHERMGMGQEQNSAIPEYATIWLAVLVAVFVVSAAALLLGQSGNREMLGDPYESSVGVTQDTAAP